ncbi:conserved hypothetical protein [Leptothrix cholodnii SP-6]|uniref:Uncharacterized protein n=1 Tax=Leptothrix cholodnii (strain ATCC 51168 / LMG 8142 / SP-6) TaxID=395495 RepID=B1XZF0_LEPCP|nr:hypothetical protein [Leptothrix cholodnii]ACB36513.1 conserved hypothetical protein [Leptothrix cholodnii SP-6]
MTLDILVWWGFLGTVSLFNLLAWAASASSLERRSTALGPHAHAARRLQLLLSAAYVGGCAFRSVFPLFDVPRVCLVDTWLSTVIVGRSVATVAELCFAAQWALLMDELADAAGSRIGKVTARALVPLIALAETCAWFAVLTTANIGHVAEASIWSLSAALAVTALIAIWPRCDARLRNVLGVWCAAGLAYVAFMALVDVPMYWSRWLADEAAGRQYLSLAQGLVDATQRCVVSHRWADWHTEVLWMSLYFSAAVWLSIALVHTPVLAEHVVKADRR